MRASRFTSRLFLSLAFLLVASCGDDDEPTDTGPVDSGRDAAIPDTGPTPPPPPPDGSLPDLGSSDSGPSDGGPRPDGGPGDSGPADTGSPDGGGPVECDSVTADLRATRDMASVCERSTECAARLSPTCPEGACHVFFTTGYYLEDMMALEDRYNALDCGAGTACRCAAPPDTFSCNDGVCGACPAAPDLCPPCPADCTCELDACNCPIPDLCVEATCEEMRDRLTGAAYDMSGCTTDEECTVSPSPLCPELSCYVAHHRGASLTQLQRLASVYVAKGCSTAVCDCAPPPARAMCNAGTCEGVIP